MLGAAILSASYVAGADSESPLVWGGSAEVGVRVAHQQAPFGDDDLTSFFDQYAALRYEDGWAWDPNPLALDLALYRPDGTRPFDVALWSGSPWNQQGRLRARWRSLDFALDGGRFRTEELRLFPMGTDQDGTLGLFPVFGSRYTPDVPASNPLGRGATFFRRRNRLAGGLTWRPAAADRVSDLLWELGASAHYGVRSGFEQDRFLLDDLREPTASSNERFRGNRRRLDQQVAGGRAQAVLVPLPGWTAVLSGDFERFRERAPEVTFGSLAASSSALTPGTPREAARGFSFVPNTQRSGGSLRLAGQLGSVALSVGGSASRLEQVGPLSALQRASGAPATAVNRYAGRLLARAPTPGRGAVEAFVRYRERHNDMPLSAFDAINPPGGHVDPFLRRRRGVEGGVGWSGRPLAGWWLDTGYTVEFIRRTLLFSSQFEALRPGTNLQQPDSLSHELHLGARTRLWGRVGLEGEIALERAPRVSLPRDFASAVRLEGRAHGALAAPIPVSLMASGRWEYGRNDQTRLVSEVPEGSRRKPFERSRWAVLLSATATPRPGTLLSAAFLQERDGQRFRHLRSNLPRPLGPAVVRFFNDSNPSARSDVTTLHLGLARSLTRTLWLDLGTQFTWLDYGLGRGPNTAAVIDSATRFRDRIASFDAELRFAARPGLMLGLGYRLEDYHQGVPAPPLDQSNRLHQLRLSLQFDLGSADAGR